MLSRIAEFVIRRRRFVLVASAVMFMLGGGLGGSVAEELSTGGFDDPGSESFQADQALLDRFDAGVPNIVLLVTAPEAADGSIAVDTPAAVAAGQAVTDRLAAIGDVTNVVSCAPAASSPRPRC